MQIARGSKDSKTVWEIQEWLCYHNHRVMLDGDFGPATEDAVKQFQLEKALAINGIVDDPTWGQMLFPMRKVSTAPDLRSAGVSLGKAIAIIANNHLAVHPIEIGGQNMGPWVRFYTHGNQGEEWPWCAGFASTIVLQAYDAIGKSRGSAFRFTLSCDRLGAYAMSKGTFTKTPSKGSLFLVRNPKVAGDWIHTGIVVGVNGDVVYTAEGNTNEGGSREGYGAFRRTRAGDKLDYVTLV